MEYKKLLETQLQLFKDQVQENKGLKNQINILETILRNYNAPYKLAYIPVIERREEN